MVGRRFNPPPGWPPAPPDFAPEPGWRPDPSWPPLPPGWQLWADDDSQIPAAYPGDAGYQPQAGSWPVPGQPGPDGQGTPGRRDSTSGWAIASFVLGLFSAILLSVIFGIVGLRRIKETGQKGRGFAIAGLALSGAWTVVLAVMIGLGLSVLHGGSGGQPSSGTISAPGGINPYSLKVGDCFDNPVTTRNVASIALIPCTQAHNAQVFAKFSLTGSDLSYRGTAATTKLATDGCEARNSALDQAKVTSAMTLHFLYPGAIQWAAGQRSVICLVVNPKPDLTSSLLAAGASG